MRLAYPTDLPLTEVQEVIATIRAGRIATDKQSFAKDLWIVQGYVLGKAIGETPVAFASMPPAELTDEDAADILAGLTAKGAMPTGIVENIPWAALLKWSMRLLVTLL